jgi:CRISPR/Cas system-associated protein endoribonuclease Cas2
MKNLFPQLFLSAELGGAGAGETEDPENKGGAAAANNPSDPPEETVTMSKQEYEANLQKEADRRVSKALNTQKAKLEAELRATLEAEIEESKKLAKLSKEERDKAEFEKERAKFEAERQQHLLEKLELETVKQLAERKLPTSFSSFLLGKDAETTLSQINDFEDAYRQSIEEAVAERLKGKTPTSGSTNSNTITLSQFKAMSVVEKTNLFNSNLALYQELQKQLY